jgi:hypothetical protein
LTLTNSPSGNRTTLLHQYGIPNHQYDPYDVSGYVSHQNCVQPRAHLFTIQSFSQVSRHWSNDLGVRAGTFPASIREADSHTRSDLTTSPSTSVRR